MSRFETTTTTQGTIPGTTMADARSGQQRSRAGRRRATNCRCGQQLDVCARDHCPRCGRTLRQR